MVKREYDYYAFISYSRKDEKWAKWIQKSVETYRFPTALRRENRSLPKKIFPIFRDQTDLSGGILEEQLHYQLDESEYLIVVCSPDSAKSIWVNEEVLYFQSLGRKDHIIPLIVDGEPHANNSERECFCPALRETQTGEILGISIPELGKKYALLRVIATLMRIRYDNLVRREHHRTMQRRIILGGILGAVLVLATGVAWYEIPHSSYYWTYVYQNEIPVGRHELSRKERQSADAFYKIVTQRNKVIRLEYVNSAGTIPMGFRSGNVDGAVDYAISEFSYDEHGNLNTVTQYSEQGNPVLKKVYSENLRAVDFKNPVGDSMIAVLPSNLLMQDPTYSYKPDVQDNITRKLLEYDENGYLVQELYKWDVRNTPFCDKNGIYGKRYERDAEGKVLHITNLDQNKQPLHLPNGKAVIFIDCEYDDCGRMTKYAMFDVEGRPTLSDKCFHAKVMEYNDNGCLSRELFYDTVGKLINNSFGSAEIRYTYDARGFLVERACYDKNGAPVYVKGGYAYHKETWEWDGNGNWVRSTNFDVDGSVISSMVANYDQQGRVVESWEYGPDGKLSCRSARKTAGVRVEYLDTNTTQYTYFDAKGNPCLSAWGYARIVEKRNEMGLVTEYHHYGADMKPIRGRENYASCVQEYDEAGRLTAIFFYDETGVPCCTSYGHAIVRYTFDNNGNQNSISFFDVNGKPCNYHSVQNGDEVIYAKLESVFNSLGQETSICFFSPDKDGKLVPTNEIRYDYNERGLATRFSVFFDYDKNENRMTNSTTTEREYDEAGRIVHEVNLVGDAKFEYTLDMEYNVRGLLSRKTLIYKNGRVISTVFEYDDWDNQILVRKENEKGQPIIAYDGFAIQEARYDHRGRLTYAAYFDENHKNVNVNGRTAVEYSYDIYGNISENRIYAVEEGNDDLVLKSMVHFSYDEFGNLLIKN